VLAVPLVAIGNVWRRKRKVDGSILYLAQSHLLVAVEVDRVTGTGPKTEKIWRSGGGGVANDNPASKEARAVLEQANQGFAGGDGTGGLLVPKVSQVVVAVVLVLLEAGFAGGASSGR
jgi:hypothetical protein